MKDIIPRTGHTHKWMFLTTKSTFVAVNEGEDNLHRMVEYAYLICNGCITIMKEQVKDKVEVDSER